MNRITSIFSFMLMMLMNSALAQTCIADMTSFDFMQTSPNKSHVGSINEIKSTYKKFIEKIGEPTIYKKTSLFFVTSDFENFSQTHCEGEKCRGTDILKGLNECSLENNKRCYPIAAIYKQKLYCLLEPSFNEYHDYKPFNPFD